MRLLTFLLEAVKSSQQKTGFFHELSVALFLKNKDVYIRTGEDFLTHIRNGLIRPVDNKNVVLKEDEFKKKYGRFFDVKAPNSVIGDAKKIARRIEKEIGVSRETPVLWRTSDIDSPMYGPADIIYWTNKGVCPISLKYKKGQLKTLRLTGLGQFLFGSDSKDLSKVLFNRKFIDYWDEITKRWITSIVKHLNINQQVQVANIISRKTLKGWNSYQNTEFTKEEKQILKDYYSPSDYTSLKRLCSKVYQDSQQGSQLRNEWIAQRKYLFKHIFDAILTREKISDNIINLFKKQIGVSKYSIWYVSEGGKNILYIPSIDEFSNLTRTLIYDYEYYPSSTGYNIDFSVSYRGIIIMKIEIVIRWKKGQMVDIPESSSKIVKQADPYLWNKIFMENR